MRFLTGLLALALTASAQPKQAPRAKAAKPELPSGRIEGQVVADAGGAGLRRARVILRPLETGKLALGVETDDRGRFEIRDVPVGNYTLTAQRDGYLTTSTFRRGSLRMPAQFYIARGDRITNVIFRLHPWSVLTGRVRFDDGDPAVNIPVELYQQYHARGRHGFKSVARATTNDRGEYRIHGLTAGSYYIATTFEGDQTGPGVEDQPRRDDSGREVRVASYTTTFYPGTERLSEALPVRLGAGEELNGIDLFMRPIERVTLGGRITHGVTGEALRSATVFLERLDAQDTGSLPAFAELRFDSEDRFSIPNIAPGWYQLWVEATREDDRLQGRQRVLVTNANLTDLEIVVLPARAWEGEVVPAGSQRFPPEFQPRVRLEPRSERGAIIETSGGEFEVLMMPGETYDAFVMNLPTDFYVSQVRANGADVRAAGLSTSMAGNQPFQIVLDSPGGRVNGQVFGPDGSVWSGAVVTLIPEPARDRLQDYREGFADQYGRFLMGGIPPGRYLLTAWLDEPVCDVYDPAGLDPCRQSGTLIDVPRGGTQELALNIKSPQGR